MIKFENTAVYGFEAAIRGMRNAMNSWDKSDSGKPDYCNLDGTCPPYQIGERDMELMQKLVKAGAEHAKFMRMIAVTVDITAPLYWLKEFDTYKVGTVANSCSTMHTIHKKEFVLEDFSCEHLLPTSAKDLQRTIDTLNKNRELFLSATDADVKKMYWWQLIQLLPTSYNQRRTVQLNYAVLRNIYRQRKGHKLDEWHDFCDWIESLPYSELILITEGVNE